MNGLILSDRLREEERRKEEEERARLRQIIENVRKAREQQQAPQPPVPTADILRPSAPVSRPLVQQNPNRPQQPAAFEIGLPTARPDTGPAPLVSSAPAAPTVSYTPPPASEPEPEPERERRDFFPSLRAPQPTLSQVRPQIQAMGPSVSMGNLRNPSAQPMSGEQLRQTWMDYDTGQEKSPAQLYTETPTYQYYMDKWQKDLDEIQAREPTTRLGRFVQGAAALGTNLLGTVGLVTDVPRKTVMETPRDELGAILGQGDYSKLGQGEKPPLNQGIDALNAALRTPLPNQYGRDPITLQALGENVNFMVNTFRQRANEWGTLAEEISALPPELQNGARFVYAISLNRPEVLEQTMDTLLNKDERAEQMRQEARRAYATGQWQEAARLSGEAEALAKADWTDILRPNENWGAELVMGLLDPTGWVSPLKILKLDKVSRAARGAQVVSMMDDATATENLAQGLARADDLLKQFSGGGSAISYTRRILDELGLGHVSEAAKEATGLLARTPDTRATMQAESAWGAVTSVLQNVTSKADAQNLVARLAADPLSLLGPQQVSGATLARETVGDSFLVGAGQLAGKAYTTYGMPIVRSLQEQLGNLQSLKGEGAYNPIELYSEIGELIYNQARRMNGLEALNRLPMGATRAKAFRNLDGTAVIQYVDKQGKVLQTGATGTFAEIAQQVKGINEALKSSPNVTNWLMLPSKLQKDWLSTVFLHLRPASWIRNGAGGAAMLMSADAWTWKSANDILLDQFHKFGDLIPSARLMETAGRGQLGKTAMTAAETSVSGNMIIDLLNASKVGRPLAWLAELGAKIAYTSTANPFSEASLFTKAYGETFAKTLRGMLGEQAWAELAPQLAKEGLDPVLADLIVNEVITQGMMGNRADIAQALRNLVNGNTLKNADILNRVGIDPRSLPLNLQRELARLINTPQAVDAATLAGQVGDLFATYRNATLARIGQAPAQWKMPAQDIALRARDLMMDAARRAGAVDPATAKQIDTLAVQIEQAGRDALGRLTNDLVAAPLNANLADIAFDYHFEADAILKRTRSLVDEAAGKAVRDMTPQAWAEKLKVQMESWRKYQEELLALSDQYRSLIAQVQGGAAYTPKRNWAETIADYINYDDAAYRAARSAKLGRAGSDPNYLAAIEAYRANLDHHIVGLVDAFRRFPDPRNFELMVKVLSDLNVMGLDTALRVQKGSGRSDALVFRNLQWRQFWRNASVYTQEAGKAIAANSLGRRVKIQGQNGQSLGQAAAQAGQALVNQVNQAVPPPAAVTSVVLDDLFALAKEAGIATATSKGKRFDRGLLNFVNKYFNTSYKKLDELDAASFDQIAEALMQPVGAVKTKGQAVVAGSDQWVEAIGLDPRSQTPLWQQMVEALRNPQRAETLEVGDLHRWWLETLNEAERKVLDNLGNLTAGLPNGMTQAQRLRVVDAVDRFLPQYDNMLQAAARAGRDVGEWAMLNFNDKRHIDSILSFGIPFPFYWSRMASRVFSMAASKPGLVNAWYQWDRAARTENLQSGLTDTRYEGSLPIPGTEMRIKNPLAYILPFGAYMINPFVNPQDSNSDLATYVNMLKMFVPGLMPGYQIAVDAALDRLDPLGMDKQGNPILRTSQFEWGDIFPQGRLAGYAWQAATGQLERFSPRMVTDHYEGGRVGRMIAQMEADPQTAKWAQDIVWQITRGVGALPEEPAEAQALFQAAAKQAGYDRLTTLALSYFFALNVQKLSAEEARLMAERDERREMGYDEGAVPLGGQAATTEFDQGHPQAQGYAGYSNLYPEQPGSTFEGERRPGLVAAKQQKKQERDAIYADYAARIDAATDDLERSKLYDQRGEALKALDLKYPSVVQGEFEPADVYGNMNPDELNVAATRNAYYQAQRDMGSPPAYPEGGTKEQVRQYYQDREAYDAAFAAKVDERLQDREWLAQSVYGRTLGESTLEKEQGAAPPLPAATPIAAPAAAPAPAGMAAPAGTNLPPDLWGWMEQYAQKYDVDPNLLAAIAFVETRGSYDPNAYNQGTKASGMMQFLPSTWGDVQRATGLTDPFDPQQAIEGAAYYASWIRKNLPADKQTPEWILVAYHDGIGNATNYSSTGEGSPNAQTYLQLGMPIVQAGPPAAQPQAAFAPPAAGLGSTYPLTQSFGVNPERYKSWGGHMGLDFKMPVGTALAAPAPATVVATGFSPAGGQPARPGTGGFGNFVILELADGKTVEYAHLSEIRVQPGDSVQAGQLVGLSGHTGVSDFPHLHLGVKQNDQYIDPTGWLDQVMNAPTTPAPALPVSPASPPTVGQAGPMVGIDNRPPWQRSGAEVIQAEQGRFDTPAARAREQQGALSEQERQSRLATTYPDLAGLAEQYSNIVADADRQAFLKAHPTVRAATLLQFDPESHSMVEQLFGSGAVLEWAGRPGGEANSAYYDQYPRSFLVQAWLYGRPSAPESQDPNDPLQGKNLGQDYGEAEQRFGVNIWDVVQEWRRLPDYDRANPESRAAWAAFYEANPQFTAWRDWWYALMPENQAGAAGAAGGFGGRSFGGYSSGGYSSGGYSYDPNAEYNMDVYIQPRPFDARLMPQPGSVHRYRPVQFDQSWMYVGRSILQNPYRR